MRKFLLAIFISLFSINSVLAFPFSFDFENPTVLKSSFSTNDGIRAFQSDNGNWWIVYLASDKKVYVEEFTSNWVSLGSYTNSAGFCFDGDYCEEFSATYWTDFSGEEYIRVIALEDDTKPRTTVSDFKLSDHSITQIVQGGDGVSNWQSDRVAIDISGYYSDGLNDDEILIAWFREFSDYEFRYSNDNIIGDSSSGDGQLTISNTLNELNQDEIQVAYCNDHYYIAYFDDSEDSNFIHSYELNVLGEPEWLGQDTGFYSIGGHNQSINDWSMWTETSNNGVDILHIVELDEDEKRIYFYAYECNDDGSLTQIHRVWNDFSDLAEELNIEELSGTQENLGDSSVREVAPTTNYGTLTTLAVKNDDTSYRRFYIKFNTSIIVNEVQFSDDIQNAELCFYKTKDDNAVDNIFVHEVYNDSWNETTINWNNQPCGTVGGSINSTNCNSTETDSLSSEGNNNVWMCFDVLDILQNDFGDNVVSFMVRSDEDDQGGNEETWYSVESGTNKPYLNISYITYQDIDVNKAFLTKDNNELFRLFYMYREDMGSWVLNTIGNFGDCACNKFMPVDICEYDKQKFTRTCSPIGCESNTSYWETTDYCSELYNETAGIISQEYEWTFGDSDCSSEWVEVGQEARCIPEPLKIPINCFNITAFEITVPEVEGDEDDAGEFTIQACTPSIDCEESTYSCNQIFNETVNYLIDREESYYSAGQTITGLSTFKTDYSCKDQGWWDVSGLKRYRVHGSLGYACQVACEEEWFCMDEQNEAYKRIDCRPTNITPCEYGCNEETGRCFGATDSGADTGESSRPTSMLFWSRILSGNITPTEKFIVGLAISGFIGMILSIWLGNAIPQLGESSIVIFIVGLGMGLIAFTIIDWINILWVIILGFITLGGIALNFMKK